MSLEALEGIRLVCGNANENWLGLVYASGRFKIIVTGGRSFYAILWI